MITQSGGGCRASNYIPLIRKALKAEFPQVPVMSLNFSGLEKGNGIEMNISLLIELAFGIFYGDTLMTLYNQCKPYEANEGDTDKARTECFKTIESAFNGKSFRKYKKIIRGMIARFKRVERRDEKKVKWGLWEKSTSNILRLKFPSRGISPFGRVRTRRSRAEGFCFVLYRKQF